ncbi:MAG: VOC family protein [Thermoleophilaceae bacterium]
MHVERVVLRVSDVELSAGFYERVAGLGVRSVDVDRADLGGPDGGPVRLELRRAERGGPAPRRAAGLFHTAFRYPQRAGLSAALRRLAEERVPMSGASDHLVSEALYLDDPDGLGVELYRDRPRDQWPEPDPGQQVAMATLPLDLDGLIAEEPGDSAGVDVGHVHLKVAHVPDAVGFWTEEVGMEVMATYGADAAFIADEGYHHHVGVNTWMSSGAELEPADGAGLEAVVIGGAAEPGELRTPDGVCVLLEG